ncbi:adenosylmethionine--8-amino-7-oxononanoate transaminase [Halothiobacillus diazotrophicus]|uniref:Adenosylmethionine-8-amino-7-oxononanoate aminotransferase n=2 Tax=Halothiobacillus diazotrophicus TaxID=1860122 RepID=A0A191ZKG7_9GAMM|nr:adenosylmethionine--8-amino-7-oxononanoate transaminase [Halothiobacillus diazotrophicus]ANJ68342.1 adenosylmethionine--8-amino-7-oxononanoate transaminase [Halothiobacillus diazotrophicus]
MTTNQDWIDRDLSVLWHPCTQMKDHETLPPIPVARGSGSWLYDFEGKRYLDAIGSWWLNLFGHANPFINERIKNQLDQLEHVILAGFSHQPVIELSERLVALTPPGLDRVFFADNGSSGIEVALKMSFHYWRNANRPEKNRFIALENSYHGETLGALGVGNISVFTETYAPLIRPATIAPSPDCQKAGPGETCADVTARALSAMRAILEREADQTCAVIVEPLVQCAAGMRMHEPAYLSGLRALCDEFDVHLIADEIAVGFGRTGTMFACEQAGITPDILCLSKGITAGYLPLAAMLTTESIYQAFYADRASRRAFLHSHSYTGNPLACAAALATLDLFERDRVIERNRQRGAMIDALSTPLAAHPNVANLRRTGMIIAMDLVDDQGQAFARTERRGLLAYRHALEHEVLLRPLGDTLYWIPPYTLSDEEWRMLADVTLGAVEAAARG